MAYLLMPANTQDIIDRLAARLPTLQRIADEHGFESTIQGDCLVVLIPYSLPDNAFRIERVFVRSMRELFLALGY